MDCRLSVLLVTLLSCLSYEPTTAQPCHECAQRKRLSEEVLSAEELRQARIELIKKQILNKLRLSEPPKPSRPVLPNVIRNAGILTTANNALQFEDNFDEYYGTTENLVLFPDNTTVEGVRRRDILSTSLRFFLNHSSSLVPGKPTAHLWVYRNQQISPSITYSLYDYRHTANRSEARQRRLLAENVTQSLLPRWHMYDVTPSLGNWIRSSGRAKSFDIDCRGCTTGPIGTTGEYRPFIILSADPTRHVRRQKRSMECSSGTSHCCREEFYLSFDEIGWNDWIIYPRGYKANFCRGSCENDISISRYHHTSLMQNVIQGQRAKQTNVTVSLCCTPSKMSSIMLLYMDKDDLMYQKRMPNMVVEACDCA